MLIRLACAVKEKKLQLYLKEKFSDTDIQLKLFDPKKKPWQELVRSCADVFLISRTIIPKPMESNIAILSELPENPVAIVLHESDSSEDHANLLAMGVDVVLFSGIPPESLADAIETTLESRRQFNQMTRFDQRGRIQPRLSDFVSNSEAMQLFLYETRQVVSSDASLLLLGETGVGKEHLSRAIHAESNRSSGPFIPINMAAIPEQLMESELFGHEQGSFTGAVRSRRGAFEMAHQGTIFLDEIGEMPLQMQSKLLRVLQDFEFTPVGSEKSVWVDVRVIAATNKNLLEEVEAQRFRADLYYRLGVITLTLPPLRKRSEDIPSMAIHFLNLYNKKIGREVNRFSEGAMTALRAYEWPGNIRELMNVIERAILLCKSGVITPDDLPATIQPDPGSHPSDAYMGPRRIRNWENKTLAQVKAEVLDQVEKAYLEMILEKTGGRIDRTADIAGINPRGLYGKMKKLGLDKNAFKSRKGPTDKLLQ